ncbi:TBC1 domain family member 25-like [Dreissena polymorpha]|uniref:Rab-GAP TBC domain-containing protein n=1 Tax=Dreissena polymorpha TaxID=45954 RepID=A0A9D4JQ57_DREPO|nr:TBC1 domain family member 25-like [Dreissena polymorpha]KAH3818719.1 hypothetical protein DPMN_120444 [Dreissena polymorpha]
MSGFYGIDSSREVIRVSVKKYEGKMQPEQKKFSIDPQITSFEMLQNLLAKAFDIKNDFTISYLSQDGSQDVYLSMLSDWDMDAAFQNASDPCLKLKVDLKPFDEALEDWDIIAPVEIPQYRLGFLNKGTLLGNITGHIASGVEKTRSQMQKVMAGMKSQEEQLIKPIKPPMSDLEFRNYMDSDGHMIKPEEFRLSIYQGGVENVLRRVVWRHLLNIFPSTLSGRERFTYMKRKEGEYFELRDHWQKLIRAGQVSEDIRHVASLVKKDVLRTDRAHKYYAGGDESKNLQALYNLLVTYALTHPEISYCQGMSDIASPLLVVQKEEAQAYLCFCGLMKRLRSNFMYDGEAITTKLQHLSLLVQFYDPVFHSYLRSHGAEDLFFCYRWLLLEMKREFPFEEALYMLEVMWSTLPADPPEHELPLKDPNYCPSLLVSVSPNSPSFSVKTQYSRLLAKRRLSSSLGKDGSNMSALRSPKSPKSTELVMQNGLDHTLQTVGEMEESSKDKSCETLPQPATILNASSQKENEVSDTESVPNITSDAINETCSLTEENSSSKETSPTSEEKTSKQSSSNCDTSSSSETSCDFHSTVVSVSSSVVNLSEEIISTSNSSFMSASHSRERFPSLIVSSCDSRNAILDFETEIISSSEGNTLVEHANDFDSIIETCEAVNYRGEHRRRSVSDNQLLNGDMNEDQAQFHLSLEETESESLKASANMPQIKGSFFSGMRRLLLSPKRRPGIGQSVLVTQNGNKMNGNNVNIMTRSDMTGLKSVRSKHDHDTEHTLFEVNKTMRGQSANSDSGNCSLASSINSLHINSNKAPSAVKSGGKVGMAALHTTNMPIDILSEEEQKFFDAKHAEAMVEVQKLENLESETKCLNEKQPSFCENHFAIANNVSPVRTDAIDDYSTQDVISDCMEVIDSESQSISRFKQLPSPEVFGYGNPFLMFICLTLLEQHRDAIIGAGMEYDELAMFFDKRVRKHDVHKVLHHTRDRYNEYLHMQQKIRMEKEDLPGFSV